MIEAALRESEKERERERKREKEREREISMEKLCPQGSLCNMLNIQGEVDLSTVLSTVADCSKEIQGPV